jgi:transcriptional regulator with XRE-family HTH domain
MVRRYAQKRGVSGAELARQAGVSRQAISALMLGTRADGKAYFGLRRSGGSERPLLAVVAEILEIPEREVRIAVGSALDLGAFLSGNAPELLKALAV